MYSARVRKVLDSKKIGIADRIKVTKDGKIFEGLLMPRPDTGDPDSVIIKLDSGYNMGIKLRAGVAIEKSTAKTPKGMVEEERYELGRTGKELLSVRFNPRKPRISMIVTGGTISSRIDYKTGGVTAVTEPRELLHNVPELADVVNISRMIKPFIIMSESMDHTHWQRIARECARELNRKDTKGVIVTHGTDTMHFTAAALSFFLRGLNKPVVLTGAQRSSDRGSSDAGMNLICSSHTAVSDIAEVGLCMHGYVSDDYCIFSRGTKVRKMHTSRRDAFRPVNEPPIAKVFPDGRMEIMNSYRKRGKERVKTDTRFEPRVSMLQTYPGSDPEIMDYMIRRGCRGFVIQATGLGQVPVKRKSWLPHIRRAVDSGIPVFLAPETIYGRLNCNVYSEGRVVVKAGAVPLEDMLPETAYVKLGWVLGHTKSLSKAGEMMLRNYAGEITERSVEYFLY